MVDRIKYKLKYIIVVLTGQNPVLVIGPERQERFYILSKEAIRNIKFTSQNIKFRASIKGVAKNLSFTYDKVLDIIAE